MQSGHRASGTLGAWFAMAGGAWFAVGPAVSRLWEHGPGPIGVPLFGHIRQTFELIGYFYGLGAVIMGLAAFALGRFVSRPALAMEPMPPNRWRPNRWRPNRWRANRSQPRRQPMAAEPMAGDPVPPSSPVARPISRAEPGRIRCGRLGGPEPAARYRNGR